MTKLGQRPKVLIVGGSFAGLATARYLKSSYDVTIVEPKDYFEYTPGALHLLTGSNACNHLLSPMSVVADGATHTKGLFLGFNPKNKKALIKLLNDGEVWQEINYDAIVLCHGIPYTIPIRASPSKGNTLSSRINEIQSYCNKYKSAESVVVVGGGLVGVEFAAELAVRCKNTKTYIVTKENILATLPKSAGKYASKWLQKNNVEVYEDDVIKEYYPRSKTIITSKGVTILSDVVVDCTGSNFVNIEGNVKSKWDYTEIPSNYVADGFVKYNSGSSPFVPVNEYLMHKDYPSDGIFAAGDIVEFTFGVGLLSSSSKSGDVGNKSKLPAIRNAHLAESQAELCAHNIIKYLNNENNYLTYPAGVFGMPNQPLLSCVSLGPYNGIIIFNNIVLGGLLFGLLGGMMKFIIERSKIAEIRNRLWGRLFWAFGHVVSNFLSKLQFLFYNIKQKMINNKSLKVA